MNSRAFGAIIPPTGTRADALAQQDVDAQVAALVARAHAAQRDFASAGQQTLDMAASAAAWAIMEPSRNRQLAELAVRDTGLGNVDDKFQKNFRKTLGLLRDLHGRKTHGVIARDSEKPAPAPLVRLSIASPN